MLREAQVLNKMRHCSLCQSFALYAFFSLLLLRPQIVFRRYSNGTPGRNGARPAAWPTWREQGTVSLAKLEAKGKIYTKLSRIDKRVTRILPLCKVPSLNEVVSE